MLNYVKLLLYFHLNSSCVYFHLETFLSMKDHAPQIVNQPRNNVLYSSTGPLP